jgi:hypothetical protein
LYPRLTGSDPAEDDGILMDLNIVGTTPFGRKVNRRYHVVRYHDMLKNPTGVKRDDS